MGDRDSSCEDEQEQVAADDETQVPQWGIPRRLLRKRRGLRAQRASRGGV